MSGRFVEDLVDDRHLLARFADWGDGDAFRELVQRYRPLVEAACARTLGKIGLADDAVQATFLLLARHAEKLSQGEGSIAPWLHRVARNAATQIWRSEHARKRRERRVAAERSTTQIESDCRAVLSVIDEEIERLPDRYRTLVTLYYVQNQTQQEVAEQLGLTYGTLRRRLEQGREVLRSRLARRGVGLGSALLVALLRGDPANAARFVSPSLFSASHPNWIVGKLHLGRFRRRVAHHAGLPRAGRLRTGGMLVAGVLLGLVALVWAPVVVPRLGLLGNGDEK